MILKRSIFFWVSISILAGAPTQWARSAEPSRTTEWEYPELSVSPRSSERLEREARLEKTQGGRWNWAIQTSATGTLAAGALQFAQPNRTKDPDREAGWAGVGVGSAWLMATWLLSSYYTPYSTGTEEIAPLPSKSLREQLTRERTAEQSIEAASRLGTRLKWLSFLSNALTSGFMIANARDGSAAKAAAFGSLALSATPLLFPHHWSDVSQQQQDYKKRIFGPVAGITVISSDRLEPAFAMQWRW